MKILIRCVLLTATLAAAVAWAQPAANPPATTRVMLDLHAAYGAQGEKFMQDRIRDKVAIVFYWSTTCAVCRDSLPELRANLSGWRDKPFALLTVNVDKNASDWLAYERILGTTQAGSKGLIALRQDEGQSIPMKLPLTLLVDSKGKVISRFEGRLAPEAWDGVADLMP